MEQNCKKQTLLSEVKIEPMDWSEEEDGFEFSPTDDDLILHCFNLPLSTTITPSLHLCNYGPQELTDGDSQTPRGSERWGEGVVDESDVEAMESQFLWSSPPKLHEIDIILRRSGRSCDFPGKFDRSPMKKVIFPESSCEMISEDPRCSDEEFADDMKFVNQVLELEYWNCCSFGGGSASSEDT